jgi:hypothetical protein
MSKPFHPTDGMIKVQGNREYLPVASRILWFRREYPEWAILTEAVTIDHVKEFAVFRCSITNETGRIMAQATKMEDRKGFGDWLEKAETGSVGRALAFLGYGVLGAKDFDEGDRLADAPIPSREPEPPPAPENPFLPLLEAFGAELRRVGVFPEIDRELDNKEKAQLARQICNESGREAGEKLTVADMAFAVESVAKWHLQNKAKAIARRPAQTDTPAQDVSNFLRPEDDPNPPFEGGSMFPPEPSQPTTGNYAQNEYLGNPQPTGGKRKVS